MRTAVGGEAITCLEMTAGSTVIPPFYLSLLGLAANSKVHHLGTYKFIYLINKDLHSRA